MGIRQAAAALVAIDDKSYYDVPILWQDLGDEAEAIVALCDSHDALLKASAAAENWLAEYETGPDTGLQGLLAQLRSALAKAQGVKP